jgi:glyoxalase family protein
VEHEGERFGNPVLSLTDPDGMRVELVGADSPLPIAAPRTSDIPAEHAIRGFDGVTLCEAGFELTAQVLEKMVSRKPARKVIASGLSLLRQLRGVA